MNIFTKLTYGLYLLTAKDGKDNGCIINTAVQQTSTPETVAASVNKTNLSTQTKMKNGRKKLKLYITETTVSIIFWFCVCSG